MGRRGVTDATGATGKETVVEAEKGAAPVGKHLLEGASAGTASVERAAETTPARLRRMGGL